MQRGEPRERGRRRGDSGRERGGRGGGRCNACRGSQRVAAAAASRPRRPPPLLATRRRHGGGARDSHGAVCKHDRYVIRHRNGAPPGGRLAVVPHPLGAHPNVVPQLGATRLEGRTAAAAAPPTSTSWHCSQRQRKGRRRALWGEGRRRSLLRTEGAGGSETAAANEGRLRGSQYCPRGGRSGGRPQRIWRRCGLSYPSPRPAPAAHTGGAGVHGWRAVQ